MKIIQAQGIGKQYIVSHEKEAMVRHILPKFLQIRSYQQFWALKDISFDLEQGQSLGVIGRNGVGKSTLLSILAGITVPTEGKVSVQGNVSTLLSLGAGFHPELTGEENIYLNGSILGLRNQEIKQRFNSIVRFCELDGFIDAPLQTYSSGMNMRLGFAIAIAADFDILLIDEILAVGDLAFQNKCLEKMKQFRNQGKTMVIVSQSLAILENLCDKIIVLEHGKIAFQGAPAQALVRYQEILSGVKQAQARPAAPASIKPARQNELRPQPEEVKTGWGTKTGTKEAEIVKVSMQNGWGQEQKVFTTGDRVKVAVDYLVHSAIKDPHFGVAIFREDGLYCYGPNTRFDKHKIAKVRPGPGRFSIEYKSLNLLPGEYRISVAIWEKEEKFAYDYHYAYYKFQVKSGKQDHGVVYLKHKWRWKLP